MRLIVHDYGGYAFPAQLSRALVQRGHEVLHLYSGSYQSGKGRLSDPDAGTGYTVKAVRPRGEFRKYSLLRRPWHDLKYGMLVSGHVRRERPDAVLSANSPLLAQAVIWACCRTTRTPFIYWLQDLLGPALADVVRKRVPVVGRVLGYFFIRLERAILLRSTAVIAICEDFTEPLRRAGFPSQRTYVVENWAPLDELPELPRHNAWADDNQLSTRQVLLYAGTLGLKHDTRTLLDLGTAFRDRPDVAIVVVSEGAAADKLRTEAQQLGLDNVLVLPFQAYADLPAVHATADVLVAVLDERASSYSVPSKTWSYFCAGRPILAVMPSTNAAARKIRAVACGIVVEPGNPTSAAGAAQQLLESTAIRETMGRRARLFAERTFDIDLITDRFEDVLVSGSASAAFDSVGVASVVHASER